MTTAQIDSEAFYQARSVLRSHEGYREDVYRDTLGFLTVGIGHRVVAKDGLRLGQRITPQQVEAFFAADIAKAFAAAKSQARELGKYTPNMIAALTSVNFQLGTGWRSSFKNTWNALRVGSVESAISRLKVSAWNTQTPVRVASFISAIRQEYA